MNSILCIVLAFVQIMSYNIRVSNAQDGPNDWEIRKPATLLMIQDQKPDVVGVQEALEDQCQYLKENVAGYAVTGDSPNPILYRISGMGNEKRIYNKCNEKIRKYFF